MNECFTLTNTLWQAEYEVYQSVTDTDVWHDVVHMA